MEDKTDSPIAVKVEGHSQCVILTYFQGDIGSMVDAHFTRALCNVSKTKAPPAKIKKANRVVKMEQTTNCQSNATDSYSGSQVPSIEGCHVTFSPVDNTTGSWQSLIARTGEAPGFPSTPYPMSPEGLSLTGQQYASSLLNLLHSERSEMGSSVPSNSKPELLPGWTMQQGYRDSVDPAVSLEPGRHQDKRDLYWY